MDLLLFCIHDSGLHKDTRVVLLLDHLIGTFLIGLMACSATTIVLLECHLSSILLQLPLLCFFLLSDIESSEIEPSELEVGDKIAVQ